MVQSEVIKFDKNGFYHDSSPEFIKQSILSAIQAAFCSGQLAAYKFVQKFGTSEQGIWVAFNYPKPGKSQHRAINILKHVFVDEKRKYDTKLLEIIPLTPFHFEILGLNENCFQLFFQK